MSVSYVFVCLLFTWIRQFLAGVTATATGTNYFGPVTVPPLMKDRPPHLIHPLYSLRAVRGFFDFPQNLYVQGLWDGAHGLSSLAEKTRKSSHLQMYLKSRQGVYLGFIQVPSGRRPWSPQRGPGACPPPQKKMFWNEYALRCNLVHFETQFWEILQCVHWLRRVWMIFPM